MKNKALHCCIITLLAVLLFSCIGCGKTISYPFRYEESKIESISIVYTLEGFNAYQEYDTVVEIEDIDEFLTKFKEIKFGRYFIGDPTHISEDCYAILVKYFNNDFEFIHYYAQDIIVGDKTYYGTVYCDEEEFNNFINLYLTDNQ